MGKEKKDDDMAVKKELTNRVSASRDQALAAARQQMKKYEKTLKKLAKN